MNTPDFSLSEDDLGNMVKDVADTLLSCSVGNIEACSGMQLPARLPLDAFLITLKGGTVDLTVTVACSKPDALTLASQLSGRSPDKLNEQVVADALGEWLNILAGQIKSLAALDYTMGLPRPLDLAEEPVWLQKARGIWVSLPTLGSSLWLGVAQTTSRTNH